MTIHVRRFAAHVQKEFAVQTGLHRLDTARPRDRETAQTAAPRARFNFINNKELFMNDFVFCFLSRPSARAKSIFRITTSVHMIVLLHCRIVASNGKKKHNKYDSVGNQEIKGLSTIRCFCSSNFKLIL